MASPLIVVVVVALADSSDEASRAMTRTVQDALAETALVVVREEAHPDDNALLTKLGDTMHASAVVAVHWSDDGHAQVRVYRMALHAWTARDVAFGADDPPAERGRSLGYGIASMVRAGVEEDHPAEPKPRPAAAEPSAPPPPPLPRWDVELAGQGAVASSTTSVGASLGAGFRVVDPLLGRDRLVVRASFAGRGGSIDSADASSLYLRATVGAAWAFAFQRFTVGPRIEAGTIRQGASRSDTDATGARWSGVFDVRAEATAAIIPRLSVVLGVGAEVALERVPIRVDRAQVTTLAPVRGLGMAGLRLFLD